MMISLPGYIEAVDLESYRIETRETMSLARDDEDKEILPEVVKASPKDSEKDLLSVIVYDFNRMFSNAGWKDADNVCQQINRIAAMISRMVGSIEWHRSRIELTARKVLDARVNHPESLFVKLYDNVAGLSELYHELIKE